MFLSLLIGACLSLASNKDSRNVLNAFQKTHILLLKVTLKYQMYLFFILHSQHDQLLPFKIWFVSCQGMDSKEGYDLILNTDLHIKANNYCLLTFLKQSHYFGLVCWCDKIECRECYIMSYYNVDFMWLKIYRFLHTNIQYCDSFKNYTGHYSMYKVIWKKYPYYIEYSCFLHARSSDFSICAWTGLLKVDVNPNWITLFYFFIFLYIALLLISHNLFETISCLHALQW